MMPEFHIDVQLRRGLTRIQVEPVSSNELDLPGCPQFVIEYFTGEHFQTLTLQLEEGTWYDRNTRLDEDQFFLRYFELGPDLTWAPDYQSPLEASELNAIGKAISNYMIVALTHYLGLLAPQYRNPMLN